VSRETIGRPMEVLLVEDSLMDASITIGALRKGDIQHRLTICRDGQEALDFLNQRERFAKAPHPDLILLDLQLPKRNGFEVLAEMKDDFELKKIPVVVLTSSDDDEDVEKCRAMGVESYIRKPVNIEKFLGVIRELKHYWHTDLILPFE